MAHKEQANAIRNRLSPSLQRAMDLNSREAGSSSWLTACFASAARPGLPFT